MFHYAPPRVAMNAAEIVRAAKAAGMIESIIVRWWVCEFCGAVENENNVPLGLREERFIETSCLSCRKATRLRPRQHRQYEPFLDHGWEPLKGFPFIA